MRFLSQNQRTAIVVNYLHASLSLVEIAGRAEGFHDLVRNFHLDTIAVAVIVAYVAFFNERKRRTQCARVGAVVCVAGRAMSLRHSRLDDCTVLAIFNRADRTDLLGRGINNTSVPVGIQLADRAGDVSWMIFRAFTNFAGQIETGRALDAVAGRGSAIWVVPERDTDSHCRKAEEGFHFAIDAIKRLMLDLTKSM